MKTENYFLIGGALLAFVYLFNSAIYNGVKGVYDAAAEDRDRTIKTVVDIISDPIRDTYNAVDNTVDTALYGPINTEYRPFGTYDGWTGAGILPIRDTGAGIIPTVNRYVDAYDDLNQQVGTGMQGVLGEYMKFAPWNIFGTVTNAASGGFSWLIDKVMPKAVAPATNDTMSIMPVLNPDNHIPDIVGPGGQNPYSYDINKLPLDPNGQPYLPINYGIVRDGKAYLEWSTPARYDPNIGALADADPSRYLPAFTPAGFNTSQGYYDTQTGTFISAYGDASIKTFNDVNTWKDNPVLDNTVNVIPGFNAPMDEGISLPVQDPSPTIINAPSTYKQDFWATHKMIMDENGNMITVER